MLFDRYFDKRQLRVVKDLRSIRRNYLQTWFFIDAVSVIPFDLLGMDDKMNFSIFKIVKILKITKMLRVLRTTRLWRRYKKRWRMPISTSIVLKFVSIVLASLHWSVNTLLAVKKPRNHTLACRVASVVRARPCACLRLSS